MYAVLLRRRLMGVCCKILLLSCDDVGRHPNTHRPFQPQVSKFPKVETRLLFVSSSISFHIKRVLLVQRPMQWCRQRYHRHHSSSSVCMCACITLDKSFGHGCVLCTVVRPCIIDIVSQSSSSRSSPSSSKTSFGLAWAWDCCFVTRCVAKKISDATNRISLHPRNTLPMLGWLQYIMHHDDCLC